MNFHEDDDRMATTTSFLGLGYHSGPSLSKNNTAAETSENNEYIGTQDAVQALMQQCMAYHQEQEVIRQQKQQEQTQSTYGTSYQQQQQQQHQTKFVMASSVAEETSVSTTTDTSSPSIPLSKSSTSMSPQWNEEDQQRIQEARARAQAVIARFHQQQEQLLCAATATSSRESEIPPALFAEQRYKGLRREEERKRKMLLKNLDYVLMQESERIGTLTAQIEQSAIYEELAKRQYQIQLEQRKQRLLQLRDGGSRSGKQRQEQEFAPAKYGHGHRTSDFKQQQQHERNTPSIAVYLSGLPNDGSIDEAYVRNLFGVYGSLRKVRFYRDKLTGKLKGDGLVVYNLPSQGNDAATMLLLETVCTQVSPQIETENFFLDKPMLFNGKQLYL